MEIILSEVLQFTVVLFILAVDSSESDIGQDNAANDKKDVHEPDGVVLLNIDPSALVVA